MIHDEKRIIAGLKCGSSKCFELLYKKYNGKVYNFIMSLSNNNTILAEDIVQNVFMKIWSIRDKIQYEGSLLALLFTIAKNLYYNELKKNIQTSIYYDYVQHMGVNVDDNVSKEVEYNFLRQEFEKLIAQLPPARQNVYRLSKIDNLSNKEIANQLGISENTVESHLFKGHSFIKQMLSKFYNN